jgi:hypothetical protein
MSPTLSELERVAQQTPVYWFFVMEDAKSRGDFDLAAEAKRQLERLGVRVIYRPAGKAVAS